MLRCDIHGYNNDVTFRRAAVHVSSFKVFEIEFYNIGPHSGNPNLVCKKSLLWQTMFRDTPKVLPRGLKHII